MGSRCSADQAVHRRREPARLAGDGRDQRGRRRTGAVDPVGQPLLGHHRPGRRVDVPLERAHRRTPPPPGGGGDQIGQRGGSDDHRTALLRQPVHGRQHRAGERLRAQQSDQLVLQHSLAAQTEVGRPGHRSGQQPGEVGVRLGQPGGQRGPRLGVEQPVQQQAGRAGLVDPLQEPPPQRAGQQPPDVVGARAAPAGRTPAAPSRTARPRWSPGRGPGLGPAAVSAAITAAVDRSGSGDRGVQVEVRRTRPGERRHRDREPAGPPLPGRWRRWPGTAPPASPSGSTSTTCRTACSARSASRLASTIGRRSARHRSSTASTASAVRSSTGGCLRLGHRHLDRRPAGVGLPGRLLGPAAARGRRRRTGPAGRAVRSGRAARARRTAPAGPRPPRTPC